jgi:HK97 family phage major capsid protein
VTPIKSAAGSTPSADEERRLLREAVVTVVRRKARRRPVRADLPVDDEEERTDAEEEMAREGHTDEDEPREWTEDDAARAEDEELERETEDELDREDDEVDEIRIAISSEAEVVRYDWMTGEEYREVLSHEAEDVDLSYARDGLPFLVGHDEREQVGIVEDIALDADGRLRGRLRFSRSQRGREIEQDILDGIRKKVSVGYDTGERFDEEETERGLVRRYRGWRPLEVSSVPIPADYEVGVGRSGAPGAVRRPHISLAAPSGKERTMSGRAAPGGATTEQERTEIVATAKQHKMEGELVRWLETGASLAQVRQEVLDRYAQKSSEALTRGGGAGLIDLSARDTKNYSLVRAINNALAGKREGLEFEVSHEIEKKMGRATQNPGAFFVPTNLQRRLGRAAPLAVGQSAGGQELRFTDYGGFIPLLRARMRVQQLGARVLSGLQGDLGFVTQPSANTFQWTAEASNPTATNFGTGLKTMSPKTGAAFTSYTRQLLAQSVESVEDLVWDDLAKVCALGVDRAAIAGTGSGNNQPLGILGTTGIGAVTLGTAGGVPTFPSLVNLETEITSDNADIAEMAYLTTPQIAGLLKQTQQFSGTNGVPIWTETVNAGLVNGYAATVSTQVPSNLTKGSATGVCHAIIFGAWSELLIGEWGAMEIVVDPYSKKPAQIEVAAHLMVDVMLRYPEAFAAIQDAKLTA